MFIAKLDSAPQYLYPDEDVGSGRPIIQDPSGTYTCKTEQIRDAMTKACDTEPAVREESAFRPTGIYAGIRAITYDGLNRNGLKTKVFAYLGFPKNASDDAPVPAIVLVHGGGGHAFLEWVKMWNDRGYAAIAMDHTGYFPTEVNAGCNEGDPSWRFGLHGSFLDPEYTNAPDNDELRSSDGEVADMWMYHAVGQTILASNILRADPRIDPGKIGVTGISWGGVITSLVIGYDARFAFAIPIYGSGYLDESKSWMKDRYAGESTRMLWSAEDRFTNVRIPVLWLCWNDDCCGSINTNSKSYLHTADNNPKTRLSMLDQMHHSHGYGWGPEESMIFADSVTKKHSKLTGFVTLPTNGSVACTLETDPSAEDVRARLYYIPEPITYSHHEKYGLTSTFMDQTWAWRDLTVNGDRICGTLPPDAVGYYIEVTTKAAGRSYVICSPYTEI